MYSLLKCSECKYSKSKLNRFNADGSVKEVVYIFAMQGNRDFTYKIIGGTIYYMNGD